MQKEEFEQLLEKFVAETINAEELAIFLSELKNGDHQFELETAITKRLEQKDLPDYSDKEKLEETFREAMATADMNGINTKIIHLRRRIRYTRLAAAAVILIMMVTVVYYSFTGKNNGPVIALKSAADQPVNDIPPGSNKAILTLADGSTIILDSANVGTLSQQGAANVIKLNSGRLAYETVNKKAGEIVYNTIATPKGGTYEIVLPDETKVWLNALSSLRFPTSFTGKERQVEITGEAYFEVAKNKAMPFKVMANNVETEVLGTHFNIMAYGDEELIKTTLIEGRVKVNSHGKSVLLSPDQQARLTRNNSDLQVTNDIDADAEIAWKTGSFNFNDADIATVMRQLSRWYDVEVTYSGSVPTDRFTGKMSRYKSLSKVLKVLELSDVHFKIEGKKIIVAS